MGRLPTPATSRISSSSWASRPSTPTLCHLCVDSAGLAEMSEEELEEYYFGRIDFDTPDHVFVERALADYRAFRCLG
eukprot:2292554-Prymnesium_polylepis.1